MPKGPIRAPEENFERHVDRSPGHGPKGDCHVWTAAINRAGYGHGWYAGKVYRAHRIAWRIKHGEWPELCVLHTCDVRHCVNPAHLFLGTRADNIADMDRKGRRVTPQGEARGATRLTTAQVLEIRELRGVERGVDLAARFGVSVNHICNIHHGRTWKHLPFA